jgi:hypothetical protein
MLLDNVKILYCSTTLILRSPFPSLLYISAIAPNSISPRIINKKSFFYSAFFAHMIYCTLYSIMCVLVSKECVLSYVVSLNVCSLFGFALVKLFFVFLYFCIYVFLVSCFTLLMLFLSFLLFTCYVIKTPAFQWRTFMCKNISTFNIYSNMYNVHSMLKILDNVNILTGFTLVLYKHV